MRTIISIIIIGLLIGCASKDTQSLQHRDSSLTYGDTFDCEEIRKNISPDIIPPQPSLNEFLTVTPQPKIIFEGVPEYPKDALKNNVTAEVIVALYVDEHGCVLVAKVPKCTNPGYGFEDAAINAAYQSKFSPAMSDDKPVGTWIKYEMAFTLNN
ncbi:MAG: TonB family protein [candidate division Zixibacteria bacterium]|nr:TonB family protein [candidate division Zixibacteria bacterium]